jgi:hypothetical protein
MATDKEDLGARMFCVEKAMQVSAAAGTIDPKKVVEDATTILDFVLPKKSSIVPIGGGNPR